MTPTDGDGLLRAILEEPDEDAPRLIYADYLDEQGEAERAELIRVQIELHRGCGKCDPKTREVFSRGPYDPKGADVPPDGYYDPCPRCGDEGELHKRENEILDWNGSFWLVEVGLTHPVMAGNKHPTGNWNRGFVDTVRMRCEAFCGGECWRCFGRGTLAKCATCGCLWAQASEGPLWTLADAKQIAGKCCDNAPMVVSPVKCSSCNGTGELPGLAEKVFRKHPVTAVTITDKQPYAALQSFAYWPCTDLAGETSEGDDFLARSDDFRRDNNLPADLYAHLTGTKHILSYMAFSAYDSPEAARDDFARACVAYGREKAGLKSLKSR